MRSHLRLFLLAAFLTTPSTTALANTYQVVIDANASWDQAKAAAQLAGGYLATITTPSEQAAVEAAIAAATPPQDGGFWIGLRENAECCYIWDTGERKCYGHFNRGEPNNGGGNEDRGQLMWSANPDRRGYWNDVPTAGYPGTNDISRLGYVIEIGAVDAGGGCGACIPVSTSSSCNVPPMGATVVKAQVIGASTTNGKLSRTIIDITEPQPVPGRVRPASLQATHTVSVTVPAGRDSVAIATALIDSINHQVGPAGFVASFAPPPETTLVQMYRLGTYSSADDCRIPGVTFISGDQLVVRSHFGHVCSSSGAFRQLPAPEPNHTRTALERAASPSATVVARRPSAGPAGVPHASTCTVDPCLVTCPAGDIPFTVILRDDMSIPIPGAEVVLDFSLCSVFPVCAGSAPYTVNQSLRRISMNADGLGRAVFYLRMGGTCPAGQVGVSSLGQPLATRALASVDQNGDLAVNFGDYFVLGGKIGTSDPTGDLDCDGIVSGSTATGVGEPPPLPLSRLSLLGPWPNVLRAGEAATVAFQLPRSDEVTLELFDVAGRRLRRQSLGTTEPGLRRVEWRVPEGMRPGLYSLRIRTGAGERAARSFIVR